jgi:hypothetical protein
MAARTRTVGVDGGYAVNVAASMASRYARMLAMGGPYTPPRSPSTSHWWLTPMPSRKRSGNASVSVRWPLAVAMASRAWMLATPVATTMRRVAASSSVAFTKALRLNASGTHRAPYPSSSSSAATSWERAAGSRSRANVHSPTRPRSTGGP